MSYRGIGLVSKRIEDEMGGWIVLSDVLVFLVCTVVALGFFAVWEEIGFYFSSKKTIDNLRLAWIAVLGAVFFFIGYK